ncbi:M48 family metallopeptidase [Hymenobacter sp. BRD67]|uniref:M48 family metallopeptidase n=1 Tax=Hymenobacter sp. BRD67 TaxID=2675877 RepID=UPI0015639EEC|nr:SprT family zinc-dependent metalloprotease [Hymenobacter sp. BRD67]QKG52988.1 M48 family metallopeptidase [Hymenobacter sp. BRD67]
MPHLQIDDLLVEVVYKRVRYLRLTVRRPDGRIEIGAPPRTTEAAIRSMVLQKQAWIRKHQAAFRAQEVPPALQYLAGETHYYQGQPYRLCVVERPGRAQVALVGPELHLLVPAGTSALQRQRVVAGWHRAQLQALIPQLLAKWEPVVGAQAAAWGIKQMKTRWGTCSIRARRIWLSLELSKWPLPCLEYVVVHELVHLHERLHNARFWGLVNQAMPTWQAAHQALKQGRPDAGSQPQPRRTA